MFATKTVLAQRVIVRALEERGMGYVLAVACDHQVRTATGSHRVDAVTARQPQRAWQRPPVGEGVKGHRFYDWACRSGRWAR